MDPVTTGLIVKGASSLAEKVIGVLDDLFTSDEEKAEAKLKLQALIQNHEVEMTKAKRDIIVAEAQSESWLTRSWRPITMLSFTSIIINNYILAPYLAALFSINVVLPIPPEMWNLLTVGIGGYVAFRGIEKTASKIGSVINKPKDK